MSAATPQSLRWSMSGPVAPATYAVVVVSAPTRSRAWL